MTGVINDARKIKSNDSSTLTSFLELEISEECTCTTNDEPFLMAGFDEAERISTFTTADNLTHLGNSELWHADGTFNCLLL